MEYFGERVKTYNIIRCHMCNETFSIEHKHIVENINKQDVLFVCPWCEAVLQPKFAEEHTIQLQTKSVD